MDNRKIKPTAVGTDVATIHVALELSGTGWLVGVCSPRHERTSRHKVASGAQDAVWEVMERERLALHRQGYEQVRIVSCYEAGRDGFWLHRYLVGRGVENHVIDPASVEVNRRGRRVKSDGVDVEKLLRALRWHEMGDHQACRMVVVPSEAEEEARRPGRERGRLLSERTGHSNRIKGLLATQGISHYHPLKADRWVKLEGLRRADGQGLAGWLRREIERELERLEVAEKQIKAVEKERGAALAAGLAAGDRGAEQIERLKQLRSMGMEFATGLVREVFYREFRNGGQVGSYFGLAPTPYQSGGRNHEQGIAKAGNRRARSLAVEAAWLWLLHQPDSELSRWFHAKLAGRKGRAKRVLIVALARKLMVALWRYVTTGLVPQGALLKAR